MTDPGAKVPKPQVRAVGALLFPGEPGYEEELARIRARQPQSPPPETPSHPEPKEKTE